LRSVGGEPGKRDKRTFFASTPPRGEREKKKGPRVRRTRGGSALPLVDKELETDGKGDLVKQKRERKVMHLKATNAKKKRYHRAKKGESFHHHMEDKIMGGQEEKKGLCWSRRKRGRGKSRKEEGAPNRWGKKNATSNRRKKKKRRPIGWKKIDLSNFRTGFGKGESHKKRRFAWGREGPLQQTCSAARGGGNKKEGLGEGRKNVC